MKNIPSPPGAAILAPSPEAALMPSARAEAEAGGPDAHVPFPPARMFDRTTPPHMLTLVLIAGLGALAMNVFLPSLPGIAKHFNSDYAVAQLAVSGYLAVTGALQLLVGPLSDRYGRRPVLLWSMGIFILATIGTMVAPSMEIFLACRMCQATVASGFALSRAIVRDMVPPEKAASMIGYVTMGMAVVPMIGPMVGGALEALAGWRASFAVLLIFGIVVFALVLTDLGETHRTRSKSLSAQMRSYPELLNSRRFWGYALTAAFASGAFFAFLGGGPYVATTVLGLSPERMGFYFGFLAAGYLAGNFFSGRYSERVGISRMMISGAALASLAMMGSFALFWFGALHPLALFGPTFFVGLGNGLTMPSSNAGLLSARPHLAGSAAGLGGALMIGGGAGLSAFAGSLLGPGIGALPLVAVMFAASGAALLSAIWVARIEREVAAEG
jgi:DHA1 family bicyclomycin/chloramphenicol resistance-like MFS transporter